ncbi:cysteine desulfurase [Devosia enhydra]|uniref:Cysteine desulfurase n=1 Tax=Devosia enhydra TaxID=665118 RepID=A0A1K2HVD4_9HYPH|nr:aminotransferase class V-fold PLP-dependent enzyme [Devosia enhydra]SFZ82688.1 cysteine desulfurase [Devosia enhydra]
MSGLLRYLDHNASAPLLPEARDAMLEALSLVGNPSSVHAHGRAQRALLEAARDAVAALAGARRQEVVFTGSATEAIAQAVIGGARAFGVHRLVVGAGEHAAVHAAVAATGLPVTTMGLDAFGVLRIEDLVAALAAADAAGETLLVCVQAANNETGVIQPMAEIERRVGPTRHVLFVDAVQAFGRVPLDFGASATDMMAVSGHKIGAPAGIGALLVKSHCDGVRLIPGGGQEQGRRGGTEAVALIAAFGAAAKAFPGRHGAAGLEALGERLECGIMALAPDAVIFGQGAPRNLGVVNFAVPGVASSVAMMGLDLAGVSVSSGSACSSGKVAPSHVLAAMGIGRDIAGSALRVSLGWSSTQDDVDAFLNAFEQVLARHRQRRGRAA